MIKNHTSEESLNFDCTSAAETFWLWSRTRFWKRSFRKTFYEKDFNQFNLWFCKYGKNIFDLKAPSRTELQRRSQNMGARYLTFCAWIYLFSRFANLIKGAIIQISSKCVRVWGCYCKNAKRHAHSCLSFKFCHIKGPILDEK